VYKGGKAAPALGDRVPGMNSVAPVYRYGWIVSRAELHEAITGEPPMLDMYLIQIHIFAGRMLYSRWKEMGYDDNEYK
jgi:hypothetical protein